MNDKNPTPDQTPENLPAGTTPPAPPAPPAPSAQASDAPTVPVEPRAADTSATPASPAAPAKRGRKRALLIGGGIAAAVVLVGGGVALGAAVGDEFGDDDDRPSMSDGPRDDDDRGAQPGDDRGDDRGDDGQRPSQGGGPVTGIGTDSADELVEIAAAARAAAEGDVTSIDAKRDGTWEVQLVASDGTETEVRVTADLEATVISTEQDDDSAPTSTLDEAAIRALVDAALAEADGMITDLDADNDEVSPYDASVLTSDNRSIDIDFGADFAVVGTDTDD